MPAKVSRYKKLDALTLVASGHTRKHAARLTHISQSTLARAKRKQRLHGDIEGGQGKRGLRAKFTPEIINVIPSFFYQYELKMVIGSIEINYGGSRL